MHLKTLLIPVFSAIVISGCAGIGAFNTPKVLEPGKVEIGGGLGLAFSKDDGPETKQAFSNSTSWIRVGVFPGLDAGLKASFNGFLGADVKYQFLKGPINMSATFGYGRGDISIVGGGERKIKEIYGGITTGYEDLYASFKLSDYYYFVQNSNSSYKLDRLVPGVTLGYYPYSVKTNFRPIIELNGYFIPYYVAVANVGFIYSF